MSDEKPLKCWAERANGFLELDNYGGEFMSNKEALGKLFKDEVRSEKDICLRLYVLDSLYSTQMKAIFGFKDLSEELYKLPKTRKDLIEKGNEFLDETSNKDHIINKIFNKKYGISKAENRGNQGDISNNDGRNAVSLISKYLYFATGFKFPIYDSLAKQAYKALKKKYFENDEDLTRDIDHDGFEKYFTLINLLNSQKKSGIDDFNKLDNLLWAIGKIQNGSFSYLISRSQFANLKEAFYYKLRQSNDSDLYVLQEKLGIRKHEITPDINNNGIIKKKARFSSQDFDNGIRIMLKKGLIDIQDWNSQLKNL